MIYWRGEGRNCSTNASQARGRLFSTPGYQASLLRFGLVLAFQDAQGFALGLGVAEKIERQAGTCVAIEVQFRLEDVRSGRVSAVRCDLLRPWEPQG